MAHEIESDFGLEIEFEPLVVESHPPALPLVVWTAPPLHEAGRTVWQHAALGGRLMKKSAWRYVGRFSPTGVRPAFRRWK